MAPVVSGAAGIMERTAHLTQAVRRWVGVDAHSVLLRAEVPAEAGHGAAAGLLRPRASQQRAQRSPQPRSPDFAGSKCLYRAPGVEIATANAPLMRHPVQASNAGSTDPGSAGAAL